MQRIHAECVRNLRRLDAYNTYQGFLYLTNKATAMALILDGSSELVARA